MLQLCSEHRAFSPLLWEILRRMTWYISYDCRYISYESLKNVSNGRDCIFVNYVEEVGEPYTRILRTKYTKYCRIPNTLFTIDDSTFKIQKEKNSPPTEYWKTYNLRCANVNRKNFV